MPVLMRFCVGRMSRSLGVCAFTSEFCETKVENFNDAVVTQHDVVRLDVAMNDADAVGRSRARSRPGCRRRALRSE